MMDFLKTFFVVSALMALCLDILMLCLLLGISPWIAASLAMCFYAFILWWQARYAVTLWFVGAFVSISPARADDGPAAAAFGAALSAVASAMDVDGSMDDD